ncbi:hypothetical protein [Spirosoma endophyticum]|uniref:hypothetical protein n=1 Tax=Spirosoma endophyticum TaxID=662367 RepID=UPI000B814C55|nr:hypothetical protein [Spirosoma endophyticum]
MFLKWAIRAIATWKNQIKPIDLIQVHGTNDKILPIQYTNPDLVVSVGGHLMVYSQSDAISDLLAQLLA